MQVSQGPTIPLILILNGKIWFRWANPSFFTATAQQQLSINFSQKYVCVVFLFAVDDYCGSLTASPCHRIRREGVDTGVHLCAHFAHSFASAAQSQPRSALSIRSSRDFFLPELIPAIAISPWGSSVPIWYYLYMRDLSLFCPLAAILRAASGHVWTDWVHIFVQPVSFITPHFWKFGLICSIHKYKLLLPGILTQKYPPMVYGLAFVYDAEHKFP